jgi:hypothetical protein
MVIQILTEEERLLTNYSSCADYLKLEFNWMNTDVHQELQGNRSVFTLMMHLTK